VPAPSQLNATTSPTVPNYQKIVKKHKKSSRHRIPTIHFPLSQVVSRQRYRQE
jgi:hypothetical protein